MRKRVFRFSVFFLSMAVPLLPAIAFPVLEAPPWYERLAEGAVWIALVAAALAFLPDRWYEALGRMDP